MKLALDKAQKFFYSACMKSAIILIGLVASTSVFARDPIITSMEYAAKINSVDPKIVKAICWVESRLQPKAVNPDDGGSPSYGLCQVKLATAQWMDKVYKLKHKATVKRLMDPTINAFYAAKLLSAIS